MKTIIVSGAIANKLYSGGEAWVRLNWVLGLKKMGFDVVFVEQIAGATCVDTDGLATTFEDSANLFYFKQVTEQFGLSDTSILIYESGKQSYGISFEALLDRARGAELLINISGHLSLEPVLSCVRRKLYLDIDPGFTQFWHAAADIEFELTGHDFYFTIGENIGTAECPIPTGNICWRHTRPPVVLEHWPVAATPAAATPANDRFTTVANWRGPFGSVQFEGKTFGLKVHEFRKFIELPVRAPGIFEIALNIHPDEANDLRLLEENQWRLTDPLLAASDPFLFREYVQGSSAEFSVAQGVYVDTGSGWFSDRTVGYLASGKPALVQDTGCSRNYPVGEGLMTFCTLDEAVTGARSILDNYQRHCQAARALAEAYFDSDKVLSRLLDTVGVAV